MQISKRNLEACTKDFKLKRDRQLFTQFSSYLEDLHLLQQVYSFMIRFCFNYQQYSS